LTPLLGRREVLFRMNFLVPLLPVLMSVLKSTQLREVAQNQRQDTKQNCQDRFTVHFRN